MSEEASRTPVLSRRDVLKAGGFFLGTGAAMATGADKILAAPLTEIGAEEHEKNYLYLSQLRKDIAPKRASLHPQVTDTQAGFLPAYHLVPAIKEARKNPDPHE